MAQNNSDSAQNSFPGTFRERAGFLLVPAFPFRVGPYAALRAHPRPPTLKNGRPFFWTGGATGASINEHTRRGRR